MTNSFLSAWAAKSYGVYALTKGSAAPSPAHVRRTHSMTTDQPVPAVRSSETDDLVRGWGCYAAEPREAVRIADRVLAIEPSPSIRDEAILLRGCALALLGEFSRCVETLAGRPELSVELPAPHQVRRALLALGIAEFRRGESARAFELWDRARRASAAAGDRILEGNALIQMGIGLTEQGQTSRAVDCLISAQAIYEASGLQRGVAVARGNLGNVMMQIGEYAMAADHFLAGLAILDSLGDRRGRAVGLASLGSVQIKAGKRTEGVASMRAAANAFQELGLRLEEAIALDVLGAGLIELENPAEAVGPLRAAAALSEATGSFQYTTFARMHCAEALAATGAVEDAAMLLRQVLEETAVEDRRPLRVEALMTLARIHAAHPRNPELKGLPGRIEALLEVTGGAASVRFLAEAHGTLAAHWESTGDAAAALRHYKEHLRYARIEAEERGKQAVARAEVELTVERLRRENELVVANNRRLEDALTQAREARARAERASRDKSTLLGIVAHDLRNPLTHIALAAEELRHQTDPAHITAELHEMNLSAQRATRLIRSLLDGAAVEQGRLRLDLEVVDLAVVVGQLCSQLELFARQKQQALVVISDGPVWAHADAGRVEQVVQNLVDNAIKFSPAGARTEVELASCGGHARIAVRDRGPGMSAADLATAFSPFAEGSAEPTAGEPTTGLGLAITRQLVVAMGGTVEVASAGPDRGCTFTVLLPAAQP